MSERVAELESRVAELQAAVDGLTQELVESKARIRELEDERDAELETAAVEGAAPADGGRQPSDVAAGTDGATADRAGGTPGGSGADDGMLEPDPSTDSTGELAEGEGVDADGIKGEGAEEGDNGESEGSDIIIA